MSPSGPNSRRVLNQSTHVKVANRGLVAVRAAALLQRNQGVTRSARSGASNARTKFTSAPREQFQLVTRIASSLAWVACWAAWGDGCLKRRGYVAVAGAQGQELHARWTGPKGNLSP